MAQQAWHAFNDVVSARIRQESDIGANNHNRVRLQASMKFNH